MATANTDIATTFQQLIQRHSEYRAVAEVERDQLVLFLWRGDISQQYRIPLPLQQPATDIAVRCVQQFAQYVEVEG